MNRVYKIEITADNDFLDTVKFHHNKNNRIKFKNKNIFKDKITSNFVENTTLFNTNIYVYLCTIILQEKL